MSIGVAKTCPCALCRGSLKFDSHASISSLSISNKKSGAFALDFFFGLTDTIKPVTSMPLRAYYIGSLIKLRGLWLL